MCHTHKHTHAHTNVRQYIVVHKNMVFTLRKQLKSNNTNIRVTLCPAAHQTTDCVQLGRQQEIIKTKKVDNENSNNPPAHTGTR